MSTYDDLDEARRDLHDAREARSLGKPRADQRVTDAERRFAEAEAAHEQAQRIGERTTQRLMAEASTEARERRGRARIREASKVKKRQAQAERDKPLTSAQRLIAAAGGDPYSTAPDPQGETR